MGKIVVEWEFFEDPAYFDMCAVRPVGDRDFNSPRLFHFERRDDALAFLELMKVAHVAVPAAEPAKITGIGRNIRCIECGQFIHVEYQWTGGPNGKGNDYTHYHGKCECGAAVSYMVHAGDEEHREYLIESVDFSTINRHLLLKDRCFECGHEISKHSKDTSGCADDKCHCDQEVF